MDTCSLLGIVQAVYHFLQNYAAMMKVLHPSVDVLKKQLDELRNRQAEQPDAATYAKGRGMQGPRGKGRGRG